MSNTPTPWSLSQNPPIGNYGTTVDRRLTTITPTNQRGYVRLSTTSQDPIVRNMEYAIDINGRVTYRYTTPTGRQIEYNNIQEMVSIQSGPNQISNWDPNRTTRLLKNSLQTNLTQRTQDIIINQTSQPSPIASPTQASGAPPSTPSLPIDATNITIRPRNPQRSGSLRDLRYPHNMNRGEEPNNYQDVIKFTQREYTPPASGRTTAVGRIGSVQQNGIILGSVTLPIQPTITDSNSVDWQQETINPIELAALDLSKLTIESGITGGQEAINNIVNALGSEGANISNALIVGAVSAAIGKNVIARTTGAILNPNIELLFNSPLLRTFNYRFQLSAREELDTDQIRKIIKFFKKGMAVRRTPAELFLLTPNVFDIQYRYKDLDSDHPYINKIKTCALTNFQVDYTPTGSYMTFNGDGSMVSYVINLTFEELQAIYQDEYDALPDNSIGY